MFKKLLMVLMLTGVCFSPLRAEAEPSIKGIYQQLQGHQFKYDGKTVEIIEFLSFYCDGCYAFEKSVPVIKGNFPKKIKWKIVPIYWGEGSPKPGEAYYLAEEAGKGEQMKAALFNAHFVEKKDIGNMDVLEGIGAKLGLGFDFSRKLRAGEKAKHVQLALAMAEAYKVDETPTLIIAGNIVTNLHPFQHNADSLRENVITILKSIIK
ncbi:MAG: DsbA family protein [Nitrospirae bacterium]|nr:DsbA family protein [Nitrospirota bacterium]